MNISVCPMASVPDARLQGAYPGRRCLGRFPTGLKYNEINRPDNIINMLDRSNEFSAEFLVDPLDSRLPCTIHK
jgi:hypothetical protein